VDVIGKPDTKIASRGALQDCTKTAGGSSCAEGGRESQKKTPIADEHSNKDQKKRRGGMKSHKPKP